MVALIDCNNFYCSCERVFQPSLVGRALIVLSNNDGCAIARSEEAKALGIKMAQPAFMIDQLIRDNQVAVHSSNYTLYDNMSNRVMDIIRSMVPATEVYSIDEIFADLSGMRYINLEQLARNIREKVITYTGIPVSVGIASTKALAKMANRYAKKNSPGEGVFVADQPEKIQAMLRSTAIGDVWGIGKQIAGFLEEKGFFTAYDFVKGAPEEWVRKELSVVGLRLLQELKGLPCLALEENKAARKNICTSRSFGKLVSDKQQLRQAIAKFTTSCAEKLRKEQTCATRLEVFIKTNPHRPEDPQYEQTLTLEIPSPTNLTPQLMKYSMQALDIIFRPGYLYQKAGVIVKDLVPQQQVQLALFEQPQNEKQSRLMQSVDDLNRSFGRDMVRFGVQDYGKEWHLKQGNLSALYTTRLDQIPKAI